ncbi:MAG: glycosyltransferase family 4 protein [Muribaculaceae bacterium]|nr:glycosyltransferase family 4 protein [Muribaculaceae bacterium]
MISTEIARQVLTIGPEHVHPKGGIAQIIYNYSREVFPSGYFWYISNSCEGNKLKKIYRLISALIQCFFILLFCWRIKIIHIHTASRFSFKRSSWFIRMAKIFGKKVILHIHGGAFKKYYSSDRDFIERILGRCDWVVVLSKAWEEWFRSTVGVKNVMVVPNVIPLPESYEHPDDEGIFHLLFLGYIAEGKGVFDMLKAISANRSKLQKRFLFHVAGNGRVAEFKSRVEEMDLHDLVRYEGWVDSNAKHKLLCQCDALALPSYFEGLPISLLEAMSYHRPVLTTPVGGIPSIVEDGVNGLMVQPGDCNALGERILYMVEHKEEMQAMGEASLEKVKPYLPDSVSSTLEELYRILINY